MDAGAFIIMLLLFLTMFIGGGYYYYYIFTDEGISLFDGEQEEEEEEEEQQEEGLTVVQIFTGAEGNWVNPVFTSCQAPSRNTCAEECLRQGFASFSYDETGTSTMNGSCRCLQDTYWANENDDFSINYSSGDVPYTINSGYSCEGTCYLYYGDEDEEITLGQCDTAIRNDTKCWRKIAVDNYDYLFDNCGQQSSSSFQRNDMGNMSYIDCEIACSEDEDCIAIEMNGCNEKIYINDRNELIEAIGNWFSSSKDILTYGLMNNWDVSNIDDMTGLFNSYLYTGHEDYFMIKHNMKTFDMDLSHWDVCSTAYHEGFGYECNFTDSNLPTWADQDSTITAITGYDVGEIEHSSKKTELETQNNSIYFELLSIIAENNELEEEIANSLPSFSFSS